MKAARYRLVALAALAGGTLSAEGCAVTEQVLATIRAALEIVYIWV